MLENYPYKNYVISNNNIISVDYFFRVNFLYNYKKENLNYFKQYKINDFETPESISLTRYQDKKYWFLILMINNRYDPYFDWILTNDELMKYAEKYVTENYADVRNYILNNSEILEHLSITFGSTISDYTPTISTDPTNPLVNYIIGHYYTKLSTENDARRDIFLPSRTEMILIYNEYLKVTGKFN